jgi:hypothetical protein
MEMTEMEELFVYWVKEREAIRVKKEAGAPKPWTNDPILQTYKFCNVKREDDTVSKWITENWIKPNDPHPNMWFAMIVARLFNWPPTLDLIGFPKYRLGEKETFWPELKELWRDQLKVYRDRLGAKIFTGAYLVSTNGVSMDKIDYILDRVLTPIWERGRAPMTVALSFDAKNNDSQESLESYWNHLRQFDGLGSFMAGQVVADLKFTSDLKDAPDWWTWAPLGPGSIRGLNRIHGRPLEKGLRQDQGLKEMLVLQDLLIKELDWKLPVHNVQNCCCEFDKMIRVKNGEGRPRSLYPGVK